MVLGHIVTCIFTQLLLYSILTFFCTNKHIMFERVITLEPNVMKHEDSETPCFTDSTYACIHYTLNGNEENNHNAKNRKHINEYFEV